MIGLYGSDIMLSVPEGFNERRHGLHYLSLFFSGHVNSHGKCFFYLVSWLAIIDSYI